jgi:hypothetical protein
LVDDEFLRDALRLVRNPAVVAQDHLDRLARDARSVLFDKELQGG